MGSLFKPASLGKNRHNEIADNLFLASSVAGTFM